MSARERMPASAAQLATEAETRGLPERDLRRRALMLRAASSPVHSGACVSGYLLTALRPRPVSAAAERAD